MHPLLLAIGHACICLSLLGCASKKNNSPQPPMENLTWAQEKLGEGTECEANTTGEYLLCTHTDGGTPQFPQQQLRYIVYESKTKAIILEGTLQPGFVRWLDATHIEWYFQQGNPPVDELMDRFIQVTDVVFKETTSKKDFLNKQ